MSRPSSITVSRSKRGTTIKATGLAAQALFDTMTARVDKRIEPHPLAGCTVHFEDHGQDFLEWDLDATGQVIDCRPSQGWVWMTHRVVSAPAVGQKLLTRNAQGLEATVNYPVAKVVRVLDGPAPGAASITP